MLNFSKLLEALNEVLKEAGITEIIHRVTAENPSNPFIYLDTAEQSITHLKGAPLYNSTEFQIKIQDETTNYSEVEKLVEDFIKAIDRKSTAVNSKLQAIGGLKILSIRVTAVKQSFQPLKETVACIFAISITVQHDSNA